MADLIQRAIDLVSGRFEKLGQTVTYTRPGFRPITIVAVRIRPVADEETDRQRRERRDRTDWLIRSAELIVGGLHTTPQRGDAIAVGGETWDLVSDANAPPYSPGDPRGTTWKLHTIKTA